MNSRKLLVGLGVIAILGGSIGLMGFLSKQKKEEKMPKLPRMQKYVHTKPVNYAEIQTEVIAFGRVKSAQPLDLVAEKAGRVKAGDVSLKKGQRFSKGQLLFYIDDKEAKLNLQAQKSNFLRDIATILPDFKVDFPDSYDAWEQYFKSIDLDQKLPELPNKVTAQEKTFLSTKNIYSNYFTIKSLEESLSKYKVYAPFSGTISDVYLHHEAFVNPGTKLAQLINTQNLELEVSVEVNDISWISKGEEVKLSNEDETSQWQGFIKRIGGHVNPQTQSIDVFIAIKGEAQIYDGMYLKAKIPGKKISKGFEIPRSALVDNNQVYTVEDTLLKIQEINVLKTNSNTVVIDGIASQKDVVIESMTDAYNNMPIRKMSDRNNDLNKVASRKKKKETVKKDQPNA